MKTALVTGASSGIGREFARQIAKSGEFERIYVIARRADRLDALRGELGEQIVPVEADLGREESFAMIGERLRADGARLSLLVAAAGFGKFGSFAANSQADMDSIVIVNVLGVMRTVRVGLDFMDDGGRIILMGSQSAFQPLPEFNVYAASKAFILRFGRALNLELSNRKITVTTVCPGYVNTEFIQIAEQSGEPHACRNFKPLFEAPDVVRKALRDSRAGRDMSVCGWQIRTAGLLAKLLPHSLVMRIWLKIR